MGGGGLRRRLWFFSRILFLASYTVSFARRVIFGTSLMLSSQRRPRSLTINTRTVSGRAYGTGRTIESLRKRDPSYAKVTLTLIAGFIGKFIVAPVLTQRIEHKRLQNRKTALAMPALRTRVAFGGASFSTLSPYPRPFWVAPSADAATTVRAPLAAHS